MLVRALGFDHRGREWRFVSRAGAARAVLVEPAKALAALRHALFDLLQQVVNRFMARAGHRDPFPSCQKVANNVRSDRALPASRRSLNERVAAVECAYYCGNGWRVDVERLNALHHGTVPFTAR